MSRAKKERRAIRQAGGEDNVQRKRRINDVLQEERAKARAEQERQREALEEHTERRRQMQGRRQLAAALGVLGAVAMIPEHRNG